MMVTTVGDLARWIRDWGGADKVFGGQNGEALLRRMLIERAVMWVNSIGTNRNAPLGVLAELAKIARERGVVVLNFPLRPCLFPMLSDLLAEACLSNCEVCWGTGVAVHGLVAQVAS